MHHPHLPNEQELKNQILAVGLAVLVLILWQYLSKPLVPPTTQQEVKQEALAPAAPEAPLVREEAIEDSPRIAIKSDELNGSLSLKGGRFDDLSLSKYRETVEKDSKQVTLKSCTGAYVEIVGTDNSGASIRGWITFVCSDQYALCATPIHGHGSP